MFLLSRLLEPGIPQLAAPSSLFIVAAQCPSVSPLTLLPPSYEDPVMALDPQMIQDGPHFKFS
jgi:hypothetical protein